MFSVVVKKKMAFTHRNRDNIHICLYHYKTAMSQDKFNIKKAMI